MKGNNENNKYNGSNEYQKAIDFLGKGCDCGCSSRIPKEEFAELRESFQALSKIEQDIFLMAQIKAMDGGSASTSRCLKKKTRSNKRTFYQWDHNTLLCQEHDRNSFYITIRRSFVINVINFMSIKSKQNMNHYM